MLDITSEVRAKIAEKNIDLTDAVLKDIIAQVASSFQENTSKRMGMTMKCESIVGILRDTLLNRYKEEFCVLQELIQNADDAKAEHVLVGISDTLSTLHPLATAPALYIANDGPVNKSNIQSIHEVGNSDKTLDNNKIGKFGLGMKSVFHLAEGFFLFGAKNPVQLPDFVTPWTEDFHPDWASWQTNARELAAAADQTLPQEITTWKNWFCVWIPARREQDLGAGKPITKEFPKSLDQFVKRTYINKAVHLLPMLKHIKYISFYNKDELYEKVVIDAKRRLSGQNGEIRGKGYFQKANLAFEFLGYEIIDTDPLYDILRASAYWPESVKLQGEERTVISAKDKTEAHAGICIIRDENTSPSVVTVNQCVYLPLTDCSWSQKIEGNYSYTVNLHGGFFVDAGRQAVDFSFSCDIRHISEEKELRGCWNQTLLTKTVFPLLLPELDRCAAVWGNEAMSELMAGLVQVNWFKENVESICRNNIYIYALSRSGMTWSLLHKSEPVFELDLPLQATHFLEEIARFIPERMHIKVKSMPAFWTKTHMFQSSGSIIRTVFSAIKQLTVEEFFTKGTYHFWCDFFKQYKNEISQTDMLYFWKRIFTETQADNYKQFMMANIPLLNYCSNIFIVANDVKIRNREDFAAWRAIICENSSALLLPNFDSSSSFASRGMCYQTLDANSMLVKIQPFASNNYTPFLQSLAREIFSKTNKTLLSDQVLNFKYWSVEGQYFSYNGLCELAEKKLLIASDYSASELKKNFLNAVCWSLIEIPESLRNALEIPADKITVDFCDEVLRTKPRLNLVENRICLLHQFLNSNNPERTIRSCRYLIHGNSRLFDCTDLLLTPLKGEFFELTNLFVKILAQYRYGTSYQLSEILLSRLNDFQRNLLNLQASTPEKFIETVSKYSDNLSYAEIPENAWETMLKMVDINLPDMKENLKRIPLFLTADGKRTRLDQHCYREFGNVFVPDVFRDEVTILAKPSKPDPVVERKYSELTPAWTHSETLAYCRSHMFKASYFPVIATALANIYYINQDDEQYLKNTRWLPVESGEFVAPNQLVMLETFNLLSPAQKKDFVHCSEVSDPRLIDLLQRRNLLDSDSAQIIFDLMTADPMYYIGDLRFADINSNMVTPAEFLAIFPDEQEFPVVPVLKAMSDEGVDIRKYWNVLKKAIPTKRLLYILNALSGRTKPSDDITQNPQWLFLLNYLNEASFYPEFRSEILPNLSLFNRKKILSSSRKVCFDCSGVVPEYLLYQGYEKASHFADALSRNATATCMDPGKELISLQNYFSGWDQTLDERLGGFVICCSDAQTDREFVRKNLNFGHRNIEETRNRLNPAMNDVIANQSAVILFNKQEDIQITSVAGSPMTAALVALQDAHSLHYGDPVLLPSSQLTGQYVAGNTLVLQMQLPTKAQLKSFSLDKINTLLFNSLHEILVKVYPQITCNLDEFWDNLLHGEQLDIRVTKNIILEGSALYLPMLGCRHPELDKIFSDLQDENYAAEDAKGNKHIAQINACLKRKSEILEHLQHTISSNSNIQKTILQSLRTKMRNTYNYSENSILFELFQNADDAAEELRSLYSDPQNHFLGNRFVVNYDGSQLVIVHWGRQINQTKVHGASVEGHNGFKRDLQKMLLLSQSDKEQDQLDVVGKFGLGFKSVFFVTNVPYIFSGRLRFKVLGGFLPDPLEESESENSEYFRNKYCNVFEDKQPEISPTIFVLPIIPDARKKMQGAIDKFCEMASIVTIFSKRIKEIDVVTPEYSRKFREKNHSFERGDCGIAFCGTESEYMMLRLTQAELLLNMNHHVLCPFSGDIPTFWATAPTRLLLDVGFIINGNFDLDTGRAVLNMSSSKNQEYADVLSSDLFTLFVNIWTILNNGTKQPLAEGLGDIFAHQNAYNLLKSFWEIFTNQRDPNIWQLKQQDKSIDLLRRIIWSENASGGYSKFLTEYPVIPSCLEGNCQTLCSLADIEYAVDSDLMKSDFVPLLDASVLQPGKVVSKEDVMKLLDMFCPGKTEHIKTYSLKNFFQNFLEQHPLLDPEWANSEQGNMFARGLKNLTHTQKETAGEILSRLSFVAADGSQHVSSDLLVFEHNPNDVEEDKKSAFAPESNKLSQTYSVVGQEIFLLCRTVKNIDPSRLANWALQVSDEKKQHAVLRYIIDGQNVKDFCNTLASAISDSWLEKLDENNSFKQLQEYEQLQVLGKLRLNKTLLDNLNNLDNDFSDEPEDIVENDIANDELKDVNFLRGVHNWWQEHHTEEIIRYNNKLYGRDVVAPLSFDISTFESREAWMELLVLGTAHCLGMRLEQHKGFIAFLRNRGYWDTYCRAEIDSNEWLDTLSDFLDKEDWNAEYAHWMKLFIRIYQFAKYLDKYVQVFEWWNDNPVENLLAIRTNSAYTGTGIDAPGLQKALGGRYNTGIHFVCREMVRRGVINTPEIYRFCFVPYKGVAEEAGTRRDSETIYRTVAAAIGTENATFMKAFDIALLAYKKGY